MKESAYAKFGVAVGKQGVLFFGDVAMAIDDQMNFTWMYHVLIW